MAESEDNLSQNEVILYGAGGHGAIVYDTLIHCGFVVKFFFDDLQENKTGAVEIKAYLADKYLDVHVHISIGDNYSRYRVWEKLQHKLFTVIHPKSIISKSKVIIGEGCFVAVGAVLQTEIEAGKCCIFNTSSLVEHHAKIGNFVHLAPGAVLCGGVTIEDGCLVGANAVIEPGIHIGKGCKIGSGSVVRKNLPDGAVAVGVPAKIIRIDAGSVYPWI